MKECSLSGYALMLLTQNKIVIIYEIDCTQLLTCGDQYLEYVDIYRIISRFISTGWTKKKCVLKKRKSAMVGVFLKKKSMTNKINKHFEPVLVCCGFFLTVR